MRRSARLGVLAAMAVAAALLPRSLALSAAAPVGCPCDCNGDGYVTVDEILVLVNIALGDEVLSECTPGDLNADQMITVDEILTAVQIALDGCPVAPSATSTPAETPTEIVTATPAPTASATPSVVTVNVGSANGLPGQQVDFTVRLSAAGQGVFGIQNVIQFEPDAAVAADAFGSPACTGASGYNFVTVFLPIGCVPGSGCNAIGASLLDPRPQPIPDGSLLYTCTVQISATASPGGVAALHCPSGSDANGASYADAATDTFPADCTDGGISVTAALLDNAP